jgi:UDP-N-acetylmuramyl pentapeptide phosphotransferase/UDP-N-acetylglucosamine-1-phosphate transferase
VDRKILLWSVTVFFGCMVLFGVIDDAASPSGKNVSLAIQAGAALVIVIVIVVVQRRRQK